MSKASLSNMRITATSSDQKINQIYVKTIKTLKKLNPKHKNKTTRSRRFRFWTLRSF